MKRLGISSLFFILFNFATSSVSVPSTYGTHTYESQTARFGIPFVRGRIYEARLQIHDGDPYLCGDEWPIRSFDDLIKPSDGTPVALLAKRGQCSFEAKARTAMTLTPPGIVKYIIVYDDRERSTLSIMSAMDASSISVGLLFITFNSGVDLIVQLMSQSTSTYNDGGFLLRLDSENPWLPFISTDSESWMIVSLTGIFIILLFCGCAFVFIHLGILRIEANIVYLREQSSQYTLLTPQQVLDLPEFIFYKRENTFSNNQIDETTLSFKNKEEFCFENSSCSICLEEFSNGEILRQLPCNHIFHTQCIRPWLTLRQPLCPLCKLEITPSTQQNHHRDYSSIIPDQNSTQQSLLSPLERFFFFLRFCGFVDRIPSEEEYLLHSNTSMET